MNTGIATIPVFDYRVLVDLTGKPKIVITNTSTGTQVGNKVAFVLLSPLGLPVYVGDISLPDATGKWTTFEITDLPSYNKQLEWGTYQITTNIRIGSTDLSLSYAVPIVAPSGNKIGNNYGLAGLVYEVRCNTGKIYVEDNTVHSYLGSSGTLFSRGITIVYPPDATGVEPALKTSAIQNSTFDIPYNGEGFNVILEAVYDYAFKENVTVRIKYKASDCFEIACHIDLCRLMYAVDDFREKVMCNPNQTQHILTLVNINTLLNEVLIAKSQPACSNNIHGLLKKLTEILGVDCYCNTNSGIGNDRDSIKNMAIQIFDLTKSDREVRDYFCSIDCGCSQLADVTGDVTTGQTTIPVTTVPVTTPVLTAKYGYSSSPFNLNPSALDALTLANSANISVGVPITLPITTMPPDSFIVIRLPIGYPHPTMWSSSQFDYGVIGHQGNLNDQVFGDIVSSTNSQYIVSKVGVTLDITKPLILNV